MSLTRRNSRKSITKYIFAKRLLTPLSVFRLLLCEYINISSNDSIYCQRQLNARFKVVHIPNLPSRNLLDNICLVIVVIIKIFLVAFAAH
ncbi:hypothetical protein CAAN1_20S01002 [[Candida] anglica]|uniref:Uncharacterized protein n=1 Tax=[Candida] anglica TaxID=148631 RepID=A0ABP0EFR6_9ASCO